MSGTVTNLDITSANSVFMLAISILYPTPQQLQAFAADRAFETEEVEPAETKMGVDGQFAAGWVPVPVQQTIMFLPGSPSARIFDVWYEAQQASRSIYFATATISLPGIGRKATMQQGVLRRYQALPNAEKVLADRTFSIEWGGISTAVL